jgi:D-sedoheptulose 7-phosphate isomerase
MRSCCIDVCNGVWNGYLGTWDDMKIAGKEYSSIGVIASHCNSVRDKLKNLGLNSIDRAIQILRTARDGRNTIFIAGNGGSASTASHWVNDLGKATKRSGRAPMRVIGLCDNTSWMTALSNDEGYGRAFAGQLENFAEPGDVLMVISASGNSENLVQAVDLARSRNMRTIALLGFDGGKLKDMVDEVILVESDKGAYELVEDVHSIITHAVTRALIADTADAG